MKTAKINPNDPAITRPDPSDAKARLYELTGTAADVYFLLEENGGELEPELEAALETVSTSLPSVLDECVQMVLNFEQARDEYEAKADTFKAMADLFYAKAKARATAADNLKGFMKHRLEELGEKRVALPSGHEVRIQKNSKPTVVELPPTDRAPNLLKPPAPPEYDKALVAAEWQRDAYAMLKLGFVVEHRNHLRIT